MRRAAADAIASVRNDQVCWVICIWGDRPSDPSARDCCVLGPELLNDTVADHAFVGFQPNDTLGPLLAALEDPCRFQAAHALLWMNYRMAPTIFPSQMIPGHYIGKNPDGPPNDVHLNMPWIAADCDGLAITVNRWVEPERVFIPAQEGDYHGLLGDADPAQLPRIQEQWHRRLDVRIASVPCWAIALAAALVPLASLARLICGTVLDGYRQRIGLCASCGYDLRASKDHCPECGAPVAASEGAIT